MLGAMEDDEPRVALRRTYRRARADEWLLVLVADGIAAAVHGGPEGFVVEVPEGERERAERAIAAFERENAVLPPAPEPPSLARHPVAYALAVALALLVGFAATGPTHASLAERGSARAGLILAGEWWRALTALTLHADLGHALGNAIAGALFLSLVFRAFGTGAGAALVVAGGTLGNLGNALLRPPEHATIGASTAVFAALGLAAGHTMVRRRAARPIWVPVGAALALLAMLGTEGERVDVGAHALGLAAGLGLGWAAAHAPPARLARPALQALAGFAATAALAGAWLLARG
jgi:membrane associated rhomboid family serine protease